MRKSSVVALIACLCFLGISGAAGATAVFFVWSGTNVTGGTVVSSGNSVTLSEGAVATLTLELMVGIDSRGASSIFLTVDWDNDLGNEVNLIAFEEISWSNASGMRFLDPLAAGLVTSSSLESTGTQGGTIFEFDGTSLGTGPTTTTLTFARLVFTTTGNVTSDGDDIFHNEFANFVGGNAPGSTINDVLYSGASVNLVPEASTLSLLALSVGGLILAGRRGRK